MKNLYKPYLLLLTITIPQGILAFLFYKVFYRIHSQLPTESITTWSMLGSYLTISCIVFTLYGIGNWIKKNEITPYGAIMIFFIYAIFLLLFFFKYTMLIPTNIPNWMLLGLRPGLYTLTSIMPVLAHTMIIVVNWTIEKYKMNHGVKDVYFLIGIPICWYVFGQFLIFLKFDRMEALIPILFVLSMVAFIFFFARIIFIILKQRSDIWQKYLAPIVFLGSILGLSLNHSLGNILGDFSHPVFYILAVVTGILMIIPSVNDKKIRLALYIAKSIIFVFTLYFFMVFLPYLPLAFVGIILIGLGILMLIPIGLMFLHSRSLWFDFNFLKEHYHKTTLVLIFIISLSVIPSSIMVTIAGDKQNLDDALIYTYRRGFGDESAVKLDIPGIKRTLKNITYMKGFNREGLGLFNTKTPYLTSLYNGYVLDGLSLSNRKIHELESIFLGESDISIMGENIMNNPNKDVIIKNVITDTQFHPEEGIYSSWVKFEIENKIDAQSEYSTVFDLPEGSYITDYYLYVADQKKYGLMADKRAANWVYQQVKNVRQDPGILSYIGGNKIAFSIFPFNGYEVRKTGIEITHRSPITLDIDGQSIVLNDNSVHRNTIIKDINNRPGVSYITKEVKETLPKVTRKPKYYFILDYSKGNEKNINNYIDRVNHYIEEKNIESDVEEIIALNYEEKIETPNGHWESTLENVKVKGGFYLDHTIKRILYNHYVNNRAEHPVVIVASNYMDRVILSDNFDDFGFTSPEGLHYYNLDSKGQLEKYSLLSNSKKYVDVVEEIPVLSWKNEAQETVFLPNNQNDSILITDDLEIKENNLIGSKWENGVVLKAMFMEQQIHPEKSNEKSLSIVKSSIKTHVMSPLTSLIVLENEAQEKVMLEKQRQILATEKPLDMGDLTEMDEPSLWMLVLLLVGFGLSIKFHNIGTRIKLLPKKYK